MSFAKLTPPPLQSTLYNEPHFQQSLGQCLLELSKEFFPESYNTITLLNNHSTLLNQNIIHQLTESDRWTLLVNDIHYSNEHPSDLIRPGYIIQIDNNSDVAVVVPNMKGIDKYGRFIVILADTGSRIGDEIVSVLIKENIMYALVVPDYKNYTKFKIYLVWPPCGLPTSTPSKCSFGDLKYNKASPKTRNTEKCLVRANYVKWSPYVINVATNEGIEPKMMDIVASVLGLNIVYKETSNKTRADVSYDGKMIGDCVRLNNGSIDFMLGSYSITYRRFKYFHFSPVYITEQVEWCVPHEIVLEELSNAINVIDTTTWAISLVFFFCIIFAVWCVSLRNNREHETYRSWGGCFFNHFAMVLGVSTPLPRSGYARYLVALFVMLVFHLNLLYSSYLTSVISAPGHKHKYETVKDIDESDLHIYSLYPNMSFDPDIDVYLKRLNAKTETCQDALVCLRRLTDRRDAAICIAELYKDFLFRFKFPSTKIGQIYCLKDKYFTTVPIALIMRKGFVHLEAVNEVIRRLISSGFFVKWKRDLTYSAVRDDLATDLQNSMITLEDLKPILLVLCWCYGAAIFVFVLEVMVHGMNRQ